MRLFLLGLFLLLTLVVIGCTNRSYDPGPFALDDEALKPYAAMFQVDREKACLTELDHNTEVKVWRSDRRSRGYDVLLRMEGKEVSRSIAFVLENGKYVWVGEQETHYSGRDYVSPDGELPEHITISYFERTTEGGFIGLDIIYWGDNTSIVGDLKCEIAQRYIKEWAVARQGASP